MMYVKKPIPVEAHQWHKNGDHPRDHDPIGIADPSPMDLERYEEYKKYEGKVVRYFRDPGIPGETPCARCGKPMHIHGFIDTLEGGHTVCPGDWIITGVKGENYPCKPDIFAQTYVPLEQFVQEKNAFAKALVVLEKVLRQIDYTPQAILDDSSIEQELKDTVNALRSLPK